MDEAYLQQVIDMTAEAPFAKVFPVNETTHCLGAVRNALLEKADGDFIFWLDGDDEFIPGFVAEVVDQMLVADADMAVFPSLTEYKEISFGSISYYEKDMPFDSAMVLEQGDIRISEAMEGNLVNVWSRGYRGDLVGSCSVSFDQGTGSAFCDGIYTFEISSHAKRILLLPETKGHIYYVREDSDYNSRIADPEPFWLSHRHFMDRLAEFGRGDEHKREGYGADVNSWLWNSISISMMMLFRSRKMSSDLRREIAGYIGSLLPEMQVMRADKSSDPMISVALRTLLPDAAAAFSKPLWKHRVFSMGAAPDPVDLENVLRQAASDYAGLRMLPDPDDSLRGIVTDGACPELRSVDLSSMNSEAQQAAVNGYRNLEELRGFGDDEVRCRVTLFRICKADDDVASGESRDNDSGESILLLSWDGHFLPEAAADWLLRRIYASLYSAE